MASQVKVAKSDIRDKKTKQLLTDIVKHAFSLLINEEQYKSLLAKPSS